MGVADEDKLSDRVCLARYDTRISGPNSYISGQLISDYIFIHKKIWKDILKFRFSEKAPKIWFDLLLGFDAYTSSKCQIQVED